MQRMPKRNPRLRFLKAWRWPAGVEKLIEELMSGFTLHVCSGRSKLGDIRLDLYEPADVKADMYHLPFRRQTFDTVICDPPWKLPYHKRPKLIYELRDVVKPGGRLILNALFVPKIKCMDLEKLLICDTHKAWRNISIISIYRKVQSQLEFFEG